MTHKSCLVAIAAACVAAPVSADEDPYKILDRVPPVFGPIWRDGDPVPRSGGFESDGVTLLSQIPLNNFGLADPTAGNDCWGYTSPSGREYAIMGLSNGFGFVEITDPRNPVILSAVPSVESIWHDIKVIGDYAYGVCQDGLGVQVIDLSDIDNGVVNHIHDWRANGHSRTHNIVSNPEAGTLWLVGGNLGNGGLIYLDLTNPEEPMPVGGWTGMYVHDACVVTMDSGPYAGREIAFCASGFSGGQNQTGLRIVDVTDPFNPTLISTLQYSGAQYCHQVWVSDDQQYAFLNDELDETRRNQPTTTRVIDISNLNNPSVADTFRNSTSSTDHNNYAKGDFLYQANYTSGLRVLDIANPTNPREIAYIDTHPGTDVKGFRGAWSCFPYFDSGSVLISDIERGLFVVRVDAVIPQRVDLELNGALPEHVSTGGGESISVDVTPIGTGLLGGSVELVFDDGTGPVVVEGVEGSGDSYTFTFPPASCGTARYHIRALTTEGVEFTLPPFIDEPFSVAVSDDQIDVVDDDFETDQGWAVSGAVVNGEWERGVPMGNGSLSDPPTDADGSGSCWMTENGPPGSNTDVDEGTTILTSPAFDLRSMPQARIEYQRWFDNTWSGQLSVPDTLVVEISDDNGLTWTLLEEVDGYEDGQVGGWRRAVFRVGDFVDTTDAVRIRFVAADTWGGVTEAGVDAFKITDFPCPCVADCDASGSANIDDVDCFVAAYLAGDLGVADCDGSGSLNVDDIDCFVAAFLGGCP